MMLGEIMKHEIEIPEHQRNALALEVFTLSRRLDTVSSLARNVLASRQEFRDSFLDEPIDKKKVMIASCRVDRDEKELMKVLGDSVLSCRIKVD